MAIRHSFSHIKVYNSCYYSTAVKLLHCSSTHTLSDNTQYNAA